MTINLRSIRCADHPRADVRVARRLREETADELRDEIEKVTPLLRWPLRIKVTNNHQTPEGN